MEEQPKNEPVGQNIEKIKEQNIKLKSQLRELAKAMDEVVQKEKQKRLNKYKKTEVDENLKEKELELRDREKLLVIWESLIRAKEFYLKEEVYEKAFECLKGVRMVYELMEDMCNWDFFFLSGFVLITGGVMETHNFSAPSDLVVRIADTFSSLPEIQKALLADKRRLRP